MARNMPLSKLAEPVKIYPQELQNVKVVDKTLVIENAKLLSKIKELETKLGDRGKILLRPSGTEPLIRVMVEAETKGMCKEYASELVSVINDEGLAK